MAKSLQEQMISAGLIDKKKAKKIKTEQQRNNRKQRGSAPQKRSGQQYSETSKELAERDRELNLKRQLRNEQNAIAAQIRQIVETHRLPREEDGDSTFNFLVQGKVKKIYVNKETRDRIGAGNLAIVMLDRQYDVVPSSLVEKLRKRSKACIVFYNDPQEQGDTEEEEYPEHKIPDDLIW